MPKPFTPAVLAANDLIEGDSVWLGAEGWVRDVRAAAVARSPEERAALEARAGADVAANRVVGVYEVGVEDAEGGPVPLKRRERIKAARETTVPVGAAARLSDAA